MHLCVVSLLMTRGGWPWVRAPGGGPLPHLNSYGDLGHLRPSLPPSLSPTHGAPHSQVTSNREPVRAHLPRRSSPDIVLGRHPYRYGGFGQPRVGNQARCSGCVTQLVTLDRWLYWSRLYEFHFVAISKLDDYEVKLFLH